MKTTSVELRQLWEKRGNKNLQYKNRPELDKAPSKDFKPLDAELIEIRLENIKRRFHDLAKVLCVIWDIYKYNSELYGDSILAFVGQQLVRGWPWTDFPLHSKKAWELIQQKSDLITTGLYDHEINDSNFKVLTKKEKKGENNKPGIVYEHWTPMSFFRDVFIIAKTNNIELTQEIFYAILIENYRVVRITQEENKALETNKFKANRPINAYELVGIEIYEQEAWEQLNHLALTEKDH